MGHAGLFSAHFSKMIPGCLFKLWMPDAHNLLDEWGGTFYTQKSQNIHFSETDTSMDSSGDHNN